MSERATFSGGRRFAIGLNVVAASLLAPLAAGLLLYVAARPEARRRLDLTSRRTFTLSERTVKVLEGVKEPVDVYTVFRPIPYTETGQPAPGMEDVIATIALHCNDLLREFELRARGKVRAHPYDSSLTGHLARIGELQTVIGEPALNLAVVACGSRRRVLRLSDLAEFDAGAQTGSSIVRPTLHGFRDEEALAKAILSVTEERQVRLGFLRGHGELTPFAAGVDASGRPGMGIWGTGLAAQNYRLREVDLAQTGALADDVDVLVISDPVKPLTDPESAAIVRFANEGGKLAVMLGPTAANSLDFPLLDQLFGLNRTPHPICQVTTVVTNVGSFTSEANRFFADAWSEQAIVKPLKGKRLRMFWDDACALTPLGRPEQSDLLLEPLIWTGNDAWVDLPGVDRRYNHQFDPGVEDRKGPYVLGYAVTRKEGGRERGRAVVLGAASELADKDVNGAPANRDFGLNLIDWLTEREQLISIAPRPFDVIQVDLTPKEFGTILLYVVVGVPGIALLLGVAIWWLRRN